MNCTNCGDKTKEDASYCTSCGGETKEMKEGDTNLSEDKWWYRVLKVVYIALYLPLLSIVPGVWYDTTPYYSSSAGEYIGSYAEAFLYSLITLLVYLAVVRLIKITVLYIISGDKPEWKKEFTKLY